MSARGPGRHRPTTVSNLRALVYLLTIAAVLGGAFWKAWPW